MSPRKPPPPRAAERPMEFGSRIITGDGRVYLHGGAFPPVPLPRCTSDPTCVERGLKPCWYCLQRPESKR